jgi:hypothetical protein
LLLQLANIVEFIKGARTLRLLCYLIIVIPWKSTVTGLTSAVEVAETSFSPIPFDQAEFQAVENSSYIDYAPHEQIAERSFRKLKSRSTEQPANFSWAILALHIWLTAAVIVALESTWD